MVTFDLLALLAIALALLALQRAGNAGFTYRGTRLITCPETGQPAAVELRPGLAAATALFRNPVLEIRQCSRWPAKRDCDQACLLEVRRAPGESLVPNIVARWCEHKSCVCCGAPLVHVAAGRRQPWLINSEREVVEWKDIPPQELPAALAHCGPVCWTCLMAETHTW